MNYVKSNVAYHEHLNPEVWDRFRLSPEIRLRLMQIARLFIRYLELPNFKLEDIVLTGSMANFNYTRYSDFDIHVVTSYKDLEADNIVEAFYQAKKRIWNDNHDITIYGHETELYVEDVKHPPTSTGVYSLMYGQWLKRPKHIAPEIDDSAINSKVRDLMRHINDVIKDKNYIATKRVIDKIKNMRQNGLSKEGEFGVENLTFKILRNIGYIGRLHAAYTQQQDQSLSLEGLQ